MPAAGEAAGRGSVVRGWHHGRPVGYELSVRYRLVIFDFDGTLADSLPWFRGVLGELADEFGFLRPGPEELVRLRSASPGEALALLRVPRWKTPFIAARLRWRMARELAAIHTFPGVEDVLRRLDEAGVTLALVSSNSRRNVRRVLGETSAARIDHWACGAALLGKAAYFRRVLARSGVAAAEALCVGDEIRDGRAARDAGLAFGAVAWGYHALEALRAERPAEVFAEVADLVRLVDP
jgi:phosphoglycolate phosphatase